MQDRDTRAGRAAGPLYRAARVLVFLLALLLFAYWLAYPSLRSAALLMDMTGAAASLRPWIPIRARAVSTEDLQVPTRFGPIAARLYRGGIASEPALIVFPGVHAGGVEEPRLDKLARRIAAAGANVLSTPLPDLRAYRLTTQATDMIEDSTVWLAGQKDIAGGGRVGIVGVSFAGGLALVAAGRPSLADRVTAVFALGAHAELPRVIRYLCLAEAAPRTLAPPHDYGVALMLHESVALVAPPNQREALSRAVVTFLDASSAESTNRPLSERLFEMARAAEQTMSEPSRSLMNAVNTRDVAKLGRQLAPYAERIGGAPALSPVRSPATRLPVYLLHGVNDNVIPAGESAEILTYLRANANSRTEILLTPLLSHAEAKTGAPIGDVWRLVRFWTRMWDEFDR